MHQDPVEEREQGGDAAAAREPASPVSLDASDRAADTAAEQTEPAWDARLAPHLVVLRALLQGAATGALGSAAVLGVILASAVTVRPVEVVGAFVVSGVVSATVGGLVTLAEEVARALPRRLRAAWALLAGGALPFAISLGGLWISALAEGRGPEGALGELASMGERASEYPLRALAAVGLLALTTSAPLGVLIALRLDGVPLLARGRPWPVALQLLLTPLAAGAAFLVALHVPRLLFEQPSPPWSRVWPPLASYGGCAVTLVLGLELGSRAYGAARAWQRARDARRT